jgi:sensor histidine kinase regulating citrate/malate metabolism
MELTREKQKQTHTKLLYEQVRAQAKEAQLVRQNRHDMRHHYHMLLSYAENGEFDKLTDYLKHQTDSIEHIAPERYCENETVNNTLRVYHQKISELRIGIDIRAAAKPNLSATDADLVCILANIFENAYHGAIFAESDAPFVRVNIRHQAGRFVILCENSCAKSLNFEEMPEYLRGIGIQSIIAAADKYGGSCRFCAKDRVFRCMVVMDE